MRAATLHNVTGSIESESASLDVRKVKLTTQQKRMRVRTQVSAALGTLTIPSPLLQTYPRPRPKRMRVRTQRVRVEGLTLASFWRRFVSDCACLRRSPHIHRILDTLSQVSREHRSTEGV